MKFILLEMRGIVWD